MTTRSPPSWPACPSPRRRATTTRTATAPEALTVDDWNLDLLLVGLALGATVTGLAVAVPRARSTTVVGLAGGTTLALLLTTAGLPAGAGVALGATAAGVLAGAGAARLTTMAAPPVVAGAVLLTALGVWLSVPDTEAPILVVGALAVWATVAWWTPTMAEPGRAGDWMALAAVIGWATLVGARGRPASAVGALACWGVVVVIPVVMRGTRRVPHPAIVLGLQAATVLAAARWAARVDDVGQGLLRAAVVLAASAAATVLAGAMARPQARDL